MIPVSMQWMAIHATLCDQRQRSTSQMNVDYVPISRSAFMSTSMGSAAGWKQRKKNPHTELDILNLSFTRKEITVGPYYFWPIYIYAGSMVYASRRDIHSSMRCGLWSDVFDFCDNIYQFRFIKHSISCYRYDAVQFITSKIKNSK